MAIIQVNVQGLMLDPYNRAYIVVLRDDDDTETLPIWVGNHEANAIGLGLDESDSPRPMTHDLMHGVIDALGAKLLSVVIHDLQDNTFYAKLHLLRDEGEVTVDARPSDAIALAVRADCPVFVDTAVFEKNQAGEMKAWLANLKPEDFSLGDDVGPGGAKP